MGIFLLVHSHSFNEELGRFMKGRCRDGYSKIGKPVAKKPG